MCFEALLKREDGNINFQHRFIPAMQVPKLASSATISQSSKCGTWWHLWGIYLSEISLKWSGRGLQIKPLHSKLSALPKPLLRWPCHSFPPFLLGSLRSAWEEAREHGSHCWRWEEVDMGNRWLTLGSEVLTITPLVFQSLDLDRNIHIGQFSLPKQPAHQTQSLPIH